LDHALLRSYIRLPEWHFRLPCGKEADYGSVDKTFDTNVFLRLFLSSNGFNYLNPIGHHHFLLAAYALLPWTGVMLMGYALGTLYTKDAAKRKQTLTAIALVLLSIFVLFRAFNIYGDPAPWAIQKTAMLSVISFLNFRWVTTSMKPTKVTSRSAPVISAFLSQVYLPYGCCSLRRCISPADGLGSIKRRISSGG
jgi:uncharacterized membrane protein